MTTYAMRCVLLILWVTLLSAVPVRAQADDVFDEFSEFDSGPGAGETKAYDPLRPYNRFMYNVNDRLYVWVMEPVASGYAEVFPEFSRVAVSRAFHNLAFPVRFVNNLCQLKIPRAGRELTRFTINTVVGMGGLRDIALEAYSLVPADEDFGQTLGHFGVGEGVPVVWPVVGFSNLRDTAGMIPDQFLNPLTYVEPAGLRYGVRAWDTTNALSLRLGAYENLKKDALDPYTFFRDGYRQRRRQAIRE